MLSFKRNEMAKYLKFDEATHTVQIIGDAPPEILQYSVENKLDVKKIYENFLSCVYKAVNEMSQNHSENNFESLSMDWKPCTFGGKDRFRNCQARVQVPNPQSQQAPNPDSKVRPSLKNPKTQFFGLGLTQ